MRMTDEEKEVFYDLLHKLRYNYHPSLLWFAHNCDISYFPTFGYYTLNGKDGKSLRCVAMPIDPGAYPDWEFAQEMGHFWPTQWVLDNLTTKFYLKENLLYQFIYGLCELYHWFVGWVILKLLGLPVEGYWKLALEIVRAYTLPLEKRQGRVINWTCGVLDTYETFKQEWGELGFMEYQLKYLVGDARAET